MDSKYLEESKGLNKASVYTGFLSKNINKNIYEYINKIFNEDVNQKIRKMDFQINSLQEEIEDYETENNRTEDNLKNKLDYVRICF